MMKLGSKEITDNYISYYQEAKIRDYLRTFLTPGGSPTNDCSEGFQNLLQSTDC